MYRRASSAYRQLDVSGPTPSRRLDGDAALDDPLVCELLEARLVGVLATFDLARGIHAVPMWFALDERSVILATSSHSRKVENLDRDRRATLVVHDSRPGFEVCGVSMVGTVEIVRDTAARRLVELVHRRYVVEGAGEDPSVAAFLASDDVALRLRPGSAFTWDERRSPASEALRRGRHALPLVSTDPRT